MWFKLCGMLLAILSVWQLLRYLKYNPQAFTADKLERSSFTLGLLALFLIGIVASLVWFLKR